jgi:cell division transport system permease protein
VLVPQARLSGPTPWVIAIMVALTVVAAATGLALRNIANAAAVDLSGGVTVQIIEARAPSARRRRRPRGRLAGSPGVVMARLVPQAEVDQLLAPWLGADASDDEMLPVPALIDVRVEGRADASHIAALRAALAKVAPGARVDAQTAWLARCLMRWIRCAGWRWRCGDAGAALAAAVLLSARALGAHRQTIEIVHNLGGTDAQIARIFQRSMGVDAALGGALGLAVGLLAVAVLGTRFAGLGAGLIAGGALGWADWLVLALVPVAAALLAMLTARLTVLSRCGRCSDHAAPLAVLAAAGVRAGLCGLCHHPAAPRRRRGHRCRGGADRRRGRIARALDVLGRHQARALLVSGVDPDVKPGEFVAAIPCAGRADGVLHHAGFRSINTISNARETAAWVAKRRIGSIRSSPRIGTCAVPPGRCAACCPNR